MNRNEAYNAILSHTHQTMQKMVSTPLATCGRRLIGSGALMWDPHTHRRQFLDVVEVYEQLFERTLIAVDLLRDFGETAVTAIDVVDLAGTVEPDTGLEHGGRDGVSLDRGSRATCEAIVWSSLARKRFRFYLLHTCMALDKILGMERNPYA